MPSQEMMIRIFNYDDMIEDCRIILEACYFLNITPHLTDKWITEYLTKNLKIGV